MSRSKDQISVVIPTHNTRDLVLGAIGSALASSPAPIEIIVVDDASGDDTRDAVRRAFPETIILKNPTQMGFAAAANRGMERARGDLILLLNSDAELAEGALAHLAGAFVDDPLLGIAGAKLRFPDGSPQWSGGPFPAPWWLFLLTSGAATALGRVPGYSLIPKPGRPASGEIDWVSGAALAIRAEAWRFLGPLDEHYLFYGQDIDLCRRARDDGWKVSLVDGFAAAHRMGATISQVDGAADGVQPEFLWLDLLRLVEQHCNPPAVRTSRLAMLAGARLRMTARSLVRPFLFGKKLQRWKDQSAAFRRATAALNRSRSTGPSLRKSW